MKLVRCAKAGNIVSGAAFFILGTVLLLFTKFSLVFFSRAAGLIMLASGIIRIIGYFSNDLYSLAFQFDFALGIFSVLFGAVLFFRPTLLISTIQLFMGAFVLINGLFALQTAMDSKKFGMKYWWILLALSVLPSLFGLALIISPFRSAAIITRVIGLTLLLVGAEKIFISVYTVVTKKVSEEKKKDYIDFSDFKDFRKGAE